MHRGVLTAYYFGGLFDQGRHAVAPEFWATTGSRRSIDIGYLLAFRQAARWHEERPSYPLCFLESQLATLLSEGPNKPSPHVRQAGNRRGRKPIKLEQVKEAMKRDFSQAERVAKYAGKGTRREIWCFS